MLSCFPPELMKSFLIPRRLGAFLTLLLFCSCATEHPVRSGLPLNVAMNKDAGRGNQLLVTLRLESGQELLFELDTGTALTLMDKSLEPELGTRLDTMMLGNFGAVQQSGVYAAPRLYLGGAPLMKSGPNILTYDRKLMSSDSGRPVLGILGMDVLQHYCIQLDFNAGIIRFLDDELASKKAWGRAFPLTDLGDACFSVKANLVGLNGPGSLIDTGYNSDGWLTSQTFQLWTNQALPPPQGQARYPNGLFGGESYPHILHLHSLKPDADYSGSGDFHMTFNGLGLHFLARHLVTLDFPKRTLYLKRVSVEPLSPDGATAAQTLLNILKKKGRLPGWSKDEAAPAYRDAFAYPDPQSLILDLLKNGDSSIYRYTVTRASEAAPWKLQKAARKDQKGDTLEQYPLQLTGQ